jgi:hypothetical protein
VLGVFGFFCYKTTNITLTHPYHQTELLKLYVFRFIGVRQI